MSEPRSVPMLAWPSDAALSPAPVPGQHTRDVLAEQGFSTAEIDRLFAAGVAS